MSAYGKVGAKSQLVLRHSTATVEIYEGAVRSSKTITSLIDWLRFVLRGPAGDYAMVGRTERTVYRNLIRPLQSMVGEDRCTYNRGLAQVRLLGRLIWIIGADNELAVSKIQGLTLAGLYTDEAATVPESFFNMATTRLSVPGAKMWATCNPEGARHWLKVGWLDKAALWIDHAGNVHRSPQNTRMRIHRYTFVLDDNPYLPRQFIERLRATYTGIWYRRYILSEWTNAEGSIFDMWDEDRHVVPWGSLPAMHRIPGAGMDYGTQNASAAVALGWGVDNRLYLCSEWRHDSTVQGSSRWTDAQTSEAVRLWLPGPHTPQPAEPAVEWLFVDPAAASMKTQLVYDGYRRVANAKNDVTQGIRTWASLLAQDRLRVADTLRHLIGEIPGYSWDKKAAEKGRDEPIKVNDHSIDAARYAIASTHPIWGRHVLNPEAKETAA